MINRLIDDDGFYLIIGPQGSGKTLLGVALLFELKKLYPDKKIFSNTNLYNIEYEHYNFDDLLQNIKYDNNYYDNAIILFDEIHIFLNSLDYYKQQNRLVQGFFSQLRKRRIILIGTSQYILNVDVRIRRQAKRVFEIFKQNNNIYEVIIHLIDGYFTKKIDTLYLKLDKYYKNYNTYEIIYWLDKYLIIWQISKNDI